MSPVQRSRRRDEADPGAARRNGCPSSYPYPGISGQQWRLGPESNRGRRLCRPLHNHSATQPWVDKSMPSCAHKGTLPHAGRGSHNQDAPRSRTNLPAPPSRSAVLASNSNADTRNNRLLALPNRRWAGEIWSGKRDSNSRPQPWQGCALPTELFPLTGELHILAARSAMSSTVACNPGQDGG